MEKIRKMLKRKKGISPVIAAILLIAITIAIAIAVAAWVFGLFTTGTAGAVVSIKSVTYDEPGDQFLIVLDNTGASADSIITGGVTIPGSGITIDDPASASIAPNTPNQLFTCAVSLGTVVVGQDYTMRIALASGYTLTYVFTA